MRPTDARRRHERADPGLGPTSHGHRYGADRRSARPAARDLRWKADGLGPEGLTQRIGASGLTLGGLLIHLAFVETSTRRCGSTTPPSTSAGRACARPRRERDHFHPADPPDARYDRTVARSRARVATAIADQQVTTGSSERGWADLRRLLLDLIEEYGRHTGQADLLREVVDGRTGEDPPADWVTPWDRA